MSTTHLTPETRNPAIYHYTAPRRPAIRRLGTIRCDMVEATPIVFKGRLYRFEYFRGCEQNEANPTDVTHFRFIDVQTNAETAHFGFRHHLGAAYTDGGYMYVTGIKEDAEDYEHRWGGSTVQVFRSADLESWEEFGTLQLPEGTGAYNTGVCKMNGVYTMLIETNQPYNFRFRFAQSTDMQNWTLLPEEYRFHEEQRYAGGPALYTIPGDPHYYCMYLEAYPGPCYANCIARSTDLQHWEYSPINPMLMFDEAEDKKIANPFLTPHEQERIARALDINNSDMEICEFNGRTIIYYSWGCQRGIEFLAEAAYEGSMKDFLQGFFNK